MSFLKYNMEVINLNISIMVSRSTKLLKIKKPKFSSLKIII